ncbi:MAG: 3-hydroxybutyryl-CoA dehydrogenase [Candidatus Methylomirabilis sp.]|nr:3-hydroxybutyryl-CoA dehydrogenase [Deltaproteobacteria bacterium]
MAIKTIGVVGVGTMGTGIVQIAAAAGYEVVLKDLSEEKNHKCVQAVSKGLAKLVEKGKLSEADKNNALGRIRNTMDMKDFGAADIVIEAVYEDVDAKMKMLGELCGIFKPDAIIATNTSSISITRLATATKRANQFVGMHFFNPVPLMGLVEVIRGQHSDDATVEAVKDLAQKLGKTPVVCKDSPGFVVNRILLMLMNEAIHALQEGIATREEIDSAMKLGAGHPMGPLALCDLVGLDVTLAVMDVFVDQFKDSKYRAPVLLRRMVEAGKLGRKTGEGFYKY